MRLRRPCLLVMALGQTACVIHAGAFQVDSLNQRIFRTAAYQPKVRIDPPSFNDTGNIECRGLWDIQLGAAQTFTDYIGDALIQQMAAYRYTSGRPLKTMQMSLSSVDFSTESGYSTWHLESSYLISGQRLNIRSTTQEIGSFISMSACERLAALFPIAVTEHLRQLEEHPVFEQEFGLFR